MNKACRTISRIVSGWMIAGLATSALAQPEVTMEFDSEFGEFAFYQPSFPSNLNPPTGFSGPTGITFQSADRLIVATARLLRAPVVTVDRLILAYGRQGHVDAIDY